jgi:hypothetical protein
VWFVGEGFKLSPTENTSTIEIVVDGNVEGMISLPPFAIHAA